METVTLTKITYNELELIINELFPKADYSFSADMEADNDSVTEFNDITKDDFAEHLNASPQTELLRLLLFFIGDYKGGWITRTILLYLCWVDIIPEGNYLIEISY